MHSILLTCGTTFYGQGAYGSDALFNAVRRHIKADLRGSRLTEEEIHSVASMCADNVICKANRVVLVQADATVSLALAA